MQDRQTFHRRPAAMQRPVLSKRIVLRISWYWALSYGAMKFADRSSASNPRTVATCSSKDREEGTYWGRTANTLRGEKGFSEFLSVIADNDMVVRTLDDDESPSMLQTVSARASLGACTV
eukprot:2217743-Rhodomonas_salina.7